MSEHRVKQHARASRLDEQTYPSKQSLLFTTRPQRTTTGQLILEMALFAAENKSFQESRDLAAGRRAQIHLQRISELTEQRQAELAIMMLDSV